MSAGKLDNVDTSIHKFKTKRIFHPNRFWCGGDKVRERNAAVLSPLNLAVYFQLLTASKNRDTFVQNKSFPKHFFYLAELLFLLGTY